VKAIAAYTAVLRLDSLSVDARRYRAEAEVASGKPERALLDLDTALTLAPDDLKLRAQRAQVRSGTRDAKAALADLDRIPVDSMDRATLRLRADLLATDGRDSEALGAYAAVVQRGDTAAGQLGLGRTFERLGRKPEAVQAYRVAARTAADGSIATFAQARLRVLAPRDTVASTRSVRVYLELSARADAPLAVAIDSTLRQAGLRLALHSDGRSYEVVPSVPSSIGEIRYFNQVDESVANLVRTATERALAARAIYLKLFVRFMSPTTQAVSSERRTPGHIEILLPNVLVRPKS
jgi:tetratricopeptide (TPR) repeat protein